VLFLSTCFWSFISCLLIVIELLYHLSCSGPSSCRLICVFLKPTHIKRRFLLPAECSLVHLLLGDLILNQLLQELFCLLLVGLPLILKGWILWWFWVTWGMLIRGNGCLIHYFGVLARVEWLYWLSLGCILRRLLLLWVSEFVEWSEIGGGETRDELLIEHEGLDWTVGILMTLESRWALR